MKGKLVGCDWELNTITLQFENLEDFIVSARELELLELKEIAVIKEELKRTRDSLFSYKRANEEIREELKLEREVTDFLNQLLEDEHKPTEEDIDKLWPIVIEVKKQRKIEL